MAQSVNILRMLWVSGLTTSCRWRVVAESAERNCDGDGSLISRSLRILSSKLTLASCRVSQTSSCPFAVYPVDVRADQIRYQVRFVITNPAPLALACYTQLAKLICHGQEYIGHKGGHLTVAYKGKGSTSQSSSFRSLLVSSHIGKVLHRAVRQTSATLYEGVFTRSASRWQAEGSCPARTASSADSHATGACITPFCRCAIPGSDRSIL